MPQRPEARPRSISTKATMKKLKPETAKVTCEALCDSVDIVANVLKGVIRAGFGNVQASDTPEAEDSDPADPASLEQDDDGPDHDLPWH